MFEDVKVGDTVYSVNGDALKVTEVDGSVFWAEGFAWQTADGCAVFRHKLMRVFWQPVHIDPPPRPKRKVTKYIVLYRYRNDPWVIDTVGGEPFMVDSIEAGKMRESRNSLWSYAYAPIEVEE